MEVSEVQIMSSPYDANVHSFCKGDLELFICNGRLDLPPHSSSSRSFGITE